MQECAGSATPLHSMNLFNASCCLEVRFYILLFPIPSLPFTIKFDQFDQHLSQTKPKLPDSQHADNQSFPDEMELSESIILQSERYSQVENIQDSCQIFKRINTGSDYAMLRENTRSLRATSQTPWASVSMLNVKVHDGTVRKRPHTNNPARCWRANDLGLFCSHRTWTPNSH